MTEDMEQLQKKPKKAGPICARCRATIGLKSTIPISVRGDKVELVHFWCAKPGEISALYRLKQFLSRRATAN